MSLTEVQSRNDAGTNVAGDHLSPGGFDYNRIQGVNGNRHVTPEFIRGVEAMAERIGTRPEYILAVMSFETGGSFSPGVPNAAGSGATGLIQFMPNTARELGTSTEALARMSATEQLEYVERYFARRSDPGDLNTLEGVYTTVLYGSPRPDANSTLFSSGTAAYRMNAPLDLNRDGRITAGEATSFVRDRIDGEAPPPRNTPGTGTTPDTTTPEPGPRPAPEGGYTIRTGDTLSGIAAARGTSVDALMRANPGIRDPDLIFAGRTLRMPEGAASGPASYTVQRGDTLSGIAARNDTTVGQLMQANPQIRNSDLIYPDQVVRLPRGNGPDTPAPGPVPQPAPSPQPQPQPSGDVPTYAPYTVYSTGNRPAIAIDGPDQMQPHHDYQTKVRNGHTLEVRDVVLHRAGQSQTQQAIPSPMDGTVVHAGPMGNAGNAVVVRDADGRESWIFHMSSVDVKVGDRVRYGQDLGNQGSTGNSTGPHVHIEAPSAVMDRWIGDLLDGRFDGRRH